MEASGTELKGKAIGDHKRSGFAIPTPKFKRRAVSAIRDFPPGCGPSSGENRQIVVVHDFEKKVKVIRDSLKTTLDRQKSYADLKRKEIEFQTGDRVFLKVSPWKKDSMIQSKREVKFAIHRTVQNH
ncbi:reverse transcriptase [Gossypium australe]|uniref:Reverse transcriptase n=1 Tax=Gossypium australe TaxID=47621 RepID=A0A5B6VY23_9ROSI|nr:reverse transcriptase [Gossypium australe]